MRAQPRRGTFRDMKFSMIFEAQVEYGTPDVERDAIRNCVEQAVFAEEVGFDGVWAVEHHSLIEYSHMSAPEIFLTAVAAKTSRIRVGHAAVCMPFGYNHPVRVAERAAMLDIISDGRLNLGAARGGTAQEMSLCGVDPELTTPQVEEALRFIGHCWREDTIQWDSDLLDHPAPSRPSAPHRGAAPGPAPPPAAVPRLHQPRDGAARRPVRRRTDGARLRWTRGHRRHAPHVRRGARRRATPSAVVSPGMINDEFVALCPTFLMDDRDEAFRKGCRALRFFAEAISHWSAPNGVAPTRGTESVDNACVHARVPRARPAPRSPTATRRRPRRHRSTTPTTRSVTPTPRSRTSNGCAPPASTT